MSQLVLSSPLPSCPVERRLFLDELKVLEHLDALRRCETMAGVVPWPILHCLHAAPICGVPGGWWGAAAQVRFHTKLAAIPKQGPCSSLPHPPTPLAGSSSKVPATGLMHWWARWAHTQTRCCRWRPTKRTPCWRMRHG